MCSSSKTDHNLSMCIYGASAILIITLTLLNVLLAFLTASVTSFNCMCGSVGAGPPLSTSFHIMSDATNPASVLQQQLLTAAICTNWSHQGLKRQQRSKQWCQESARRRWPRPRDAGRISPKKDP